MSIITRQLIKSSTFAFVNRCFHLSRQCAEYDGEGKTTITVLNKNLDYGLMIDNVAEHGFQLNNGIRIVGPMIAFPKLMISWNIACSPDMNEQSFSLLLHLEPKLDIVIVGLDDEYPHNAPFIRNMKEIFGNYKIPLEILPVYHACSTFNFLNSEHRYVAAALIPPRVRRAEDLLLKDKDKSYQLPSQVPDKEINQSLDSEDVFIEDYELLNPDTKKANKENKDYFRVRRPFRADVTSQQPHPPDKDDKSS